MVANNDDPSSSSLDGVRQQQQQQHRHTSTRLRRKPPSPNSILDRKALQRALEERGIAFKQIHLDGLYQSLHRQHYPDLPTFVQNYELYERKILTDVPPVGPLKNAVSNRKNRNKISLPKPVLEFLKDPDNGFVTVTSRVAVQKTSGDGMTTKLAIELHDGQMVESVLMRYLSHEGSRASLCVSSQCGCAMGCTFCATGTMGLSGNLTSGEILEQMVHADRILAQEWEERWKENSQFHKKSNSNDEDKEEDAPNVKLDLVRNVVFMGMGEPLDNYTNVVDACRALIDRKRWNLAHGRVTVSTVGLVSQIRKLTKELPEVSLALSLHAPNQPLRTSIVPTATRYPIESLIEALDEHMMAYLQKRKQRLAKAAAAAGKAEDYTSEERIKESSRRRAMIEYVMLEGETSTFECAHQLGKLCENRQLTVNLIPYNKTNVKDKLACPSWEHMKEFQNIVSSYGTFCTIRRTMGADIDSACGQLITAGQNNAVPQNLNDSSEGKEEADNVKDIEDAASPSRFKEMATASRGRSPASTKRGLPQQRQESDDGDDKKLLSKSDHNDTTKQACHSNLEQWILPLSLATSVSATCFAVATVLFLKQSQRR
ncbi:hypothetical protein ACA910_014605 [Epithemia clementina (nom. ined.)]